MTIPQEAMHVEPAADLCGFKQCNQKLGHSGPHGIVGPFPFVLAPYGGDEGFVSPPTRVDLTCDSCGKTMTLRRYEHGGGEFTCTACDQVWRFQADGSATCTIFSRMYPSQMKEGSKVFDEYLDYRISETKFTATARALCGLITQEEATRRIDTIETAVAEKRREILDRSPLARLLRWWKDR